MKRHAIPTAAYASFESFDDAQEYINTVAGQRVVIKADGLAAGKGVVLPGSQEEAIETLKEMMVDGKFGSAGLSVIVEEFLEGDEISLHTFCDGVTHVTLPPGQDHKRIFEGGPNTGGMGVYAPVPFVTTELMAEIDATIIKPTLDALRSEGDPLRTGDGTKTMELTMYARTHLPRTPVYWSNAYPHRTKGP